MEEIWRRAIIRALIIFRRCEDEDQERQAGCVSSDNNDHGDIKHELITNVAI